MGRGRLKLNQEDGAPLNGSEARAPLSSCSVTLSPLCSESIKDQVLSPSLDVTKSSPSPSISPSLPSLSVV